jgi:hypothetical protein
MLQHKEYDTVTITHHNTTQDFVGDPLEQSSPAVTKEQTITETITTLELINYQVAELSRIKEELERRLTALFEHGDDYSKTYIHNKWKVTITNKYIYSLDKEEFAICESRIPVPFNPVKKKVVFEIDKSIIRDAEKYASEDELALLAQFISKKPAKTHVAIKAGV